jgi:hypothetical protein
MRKDGSAVLGVCMTESVGGMCGAMYVCLGAGTYVRHHGSVENGRLADGERADCEECGAALNSSFEGLDVWAPSAPSASIDDEDDGDDVWAPEDELFHSQVTVEGPSGPVEVDSGMAGLLDAVWRLDVPTRFSCQGGPATVGPPDEDDYDDRGYMTVESRPGLRALLERLCSAGFEVDAVTAQEDRGARLLSPCGVSVVMSEPISTGGFRCVLRFAGGHADQLAEACRAAPADPRGEHVVRRVVSTLDAQVVAIASNKPRYRRAAEAWRPRTPRPG